MAQEAVVEAEDSSGKGVAWNEAVVVCRACGHLVPRTMMCLYCGAPILFRKPRPP